MNAKLIVNPAAGGRTQDLIHKIEMLLIRSVSLETLATGKRGDAFEFARNLDSCGLIIVAGGDGTINEVINGLLASGKDNAGEIPIALIPTGTANVLAKELGVPEGIEGAVELAVSGTAKKISLGRINNRYFTLMAGVGFDGEVVFEVENGSLKAIAGKAAYVWAGIKTMLRYRPERISITTPDEKLSGYSVIVSNARCYGGSFQIAPEASVSEPLLDICIVEEKGRKGILELISSLLRSKKSESRYLTYIKTPGLELSSEGQVHIQVDGDYFGTLPARIDVVKDAVRIIY